MSIDKLYGSIPRSRLATPIEKPFIQQNASMPDTKGFGDMLVDALSEVSEVQKSAEVQVSQSMAGEKQVPPHELMISLEKADVAFQLMNKVRSNLIRAYEEVMRTQV
jgi:flagellar hook-basal body complex protein FliE